MVFLLLSGIVWFVNRLRTSVQHRPSCLGSHHRDTLAGNLFPPSGVHLRVYRSGDDSQPNLTIDTWIRLRWTTGRCDGETFQRFAA